jgi:predicted site-specific integrase-resolvase
MSIRPTHITILEWGQRFSPPPHKNTICRWIHQGLIQPPPVKVGRRWYLAENAEYVKYRDLCRDLVDQTDADEGGRN